jgi:alpha-tubulin suppressor-like RCC1 family protein
MVFRHKSCSCRVLLLLYSVPLLALPAPCRRSFLNCPLVGGSRNTLAIDAEGGLWSWGWNARGTLGHGHRCAHGQRRWQQQQKPDTRKLGCGPGWGWNAFRAPGIDTAGVMRIAATAADLGAAVSHLQREGGLWSWGWNARGTLGHGHR